MTQDQMLNLGYAFATVLFTVVLIVLIKVFGNLKTGLIGPELNLLTYGFLWDTISGATRGENYWPHITPELTAFKTLILIFIVFINTVLMAWNFKLADQVENINLYTKSQKKWRKLWSTFFGVLSFIFFLTIKTFWE
jgi:hypothetical protein